MTTLDMVTIEVRVLDSDDRQVLIEHDGVEVLLTLASVDLVPKGAWATLTVERSTAETLGLFDHAAGYAKDPATIETTLFRGAGG